MYKPGKKGATILITRSKGESFEVVETVADIFVQPFLNVFLKGNIKGEKEMQQYEIHQVTSKHQSFQCDKCEREFTTKHGLGIHLAWHTKNQKIDFLCKPDIPAQKPTCEQGKLQKSKCEMCDQVFTGEHKYQTIQELLLHKKLCSNKRTLDTQYRVKKDCDECGYPAKNEKDLMNHLRDDHLNVSASASPPPKKKSLLKIKKRDRK